MPQNTPMKRQFTTIDGRTVMSNLPQHWGGNDWAITGVDNPLPVGNYVQTEAGVWIPQKGSDDGAADVRLTEDVKEEVIFERQIYTEGTITTSSPVVPPAWATKAIVKFRIYGITGNISGISLNSAYYTPLLVDLFRLSTNTTSPIRVGHIFGESELGDLTIGGDDRKALLTKLLPREGIRVYVIINGQFSAGEGVDLEVRVSWM